MFRLDAAVPRSCPASVPLGSFELTVQPPGAGAPRSARDVNIVRSGDKLVYAPIGNPGDDAKKARISLVLVPSDKNAKLSVTDPLPANKRAEWTAPARLAVIGVVYGPQGLDHKKVENLLAKDKELITQLADYAQQTAQVEALIDTLRSAEQGPAPSRNLEAALSGFAAQYGTTVPKLDRSASTDQQAAALFSALNPALGAYDPLAPTAASRMQQSAGLAASVAALFLGSNVGLAAGGAAMVQNFRTMLFPGTDFRSALAQPAEKNGFTLCAKREAAKRTRMAYLWAYRVPDAGAPKLSLVAPVHVPAGLKSAVAATAATAPEWASAARAHDWTLVPAEGQPLPVPVAVKTTGEARALELDLKGVPAGTYHLAAKWDWDSFEVAGDVNVHALSDLKTVIVPAESRDRLVEATGLVPVKLTGPDLEFVEKITLDKQPLEFKLPAGRRGGPQTSLETAVDTNRFKAGTYKLALQQADGSIAEIPVRVLPPNPKIDGLPLRANLGEEKQRIVLRGKGLARIERIESDQASIELGQGAAEDASRDLFIRLSETAKKGDRIALAVKVEGMESPLQMPGAIEIAGPRPRIAQMSVSVAEDLGVTLKDGELPSGSFASISMRVENVDSRPAVHIACAESEKTLAAQTLRSGERLNSVRVDSAGPGTLFVSLDAGAIGRAGCTLTAVVETDEAGKSDVRELGRVVRLPRISGFTLTDERAGDTAYVGVLTGYDLETIERAGWDPHVGLPVNDLPRPVAGERDRQTLRIPLSWPAPAPHAPVYVWLRGETEGRATRAKY
ncbi:MAG: hypothetical protein ACM336_01335 [Acidobacteriota bacterium]